MKSKELYEAKLREDPMARAPATAKPRPSVHAAMAMRSPVISTLFPTPLVRIRVRNPNPNPNLNPNPNPNPITLTLTLTLALALALTLTLTLSRTACTARPSSGRPSRRSPASRRSRATYPNPPELLTLTAVLPKSY